MVVGCLELKRGGAEAKAAELIERAAEIGSAVAQNNLGLMYDEGIGMRQNKRKAVTLLTDAANQGYGKALRRMGDLHATGNGVPKDNARAQDYYLKASAAGE